MTRCGQDQRDYRGQDDTNTHDKEQKDGPM
jgi:hypothetical protein